MNIPCPHCSDVLFHLAGLDDKGTQAKHKSDPSVQSDTKGYFVICASCNKRVDLEATLGQSGLPGFRVAPHQQNGT
jgi:hypothetical protein